MKKWLWWLIVTVWLLVVWAVPLPIRTDIGRWDASAVHNFYGSEYGAGTTFRWSRPDAHVVLTGVGAGTYELQIMASSVVPTMVRIQVAEQEHMIAVQPGFARYAVPLTVPMRWQDTVTVHLHVPQPSTIDRREIGIAIDDVRLVPQGVVWPAWFAWLLSMAVVALSLVWGRWWLRQPHMRWIGVLALVSVVILLRRGDAVQGLWLWMLVSSTSLVTGHQWALARRHVGWLIVTIATVVVALLWFRGIVIWQPLWQFMILMAGVWVMRWRRWWWPPMRAYRRYIVIALMLAVCTLGPVGWVMASVIGVVWIGAKRWALLRAAASVAALIDQWLLGRRFVGAQGQSRRFGLDVLRAFAISCVVLGHASATLVYYPDAFAWIPHWFAFVGVECFFVLSGWLIGGLIIRALPTWQHPDAMSLFLHRRWGRTLPPYWLMLTLVALAGCGGASWYSLAPYWLFGQKLWYAHPPYFFVAWSLAVEEWFYALLAIGLFIGARIMTPRRALMTLLTIVALVPMGVRSWFAFGDLPWEAGLRQFVLLRLDAIALGVLMVWWWRETGAAHRCWRWLSWIGAVGALASIWLFQARYVELDYADMPRLLLIPITTGSVALLLPVLANWQSDATHAWQRALQWCAHVSYSLYLVHIPWRLTVEGLFGGIGMTWWLDALITIAYIGGVLWISGAWYRLLEAPLMALRWPEKSANPPSL